MTKITTPPEVATLFRGYAARRGRVAGRCERCGRSFEGYATRRFCSNVCRALTSRDRRKRPPAAAPQEPETSPPA